MCCTIHTMSISNKRVKYGLLVAFLLGAVFMVAYVPMTSFADDCGEGEVKIATAGGGTICAKKGTLENTLARGNVSLEIFLTLVNLLIAIVVSAAFLNFFWNLAKYIREPGPDGKDAAKGKMLWALLAIFVITSLWGIIAFARGVLGVGNEDRAPLIELPAVGFAKSKSFTEDILLLTQYSSGGVAACGCTVEDVRKVFQRAGIQVDPEEKEDFETGFAEYKKKHGFQ